ncbi:MAG TPA: hypothetical protein IGR64_15430 [Leptolyngbyaceae cyanobacterium M65_K2018_010]|nr:hypothetical protein [Leptolyngbyaceae cyanobacterium M65_K2018_010]
MEIKELLTGFAQLTLFSVMLSMGMSLGFEGITLLWRRPGLLVRSFLAAFLVVPLAALVVTHLLPLSLEVRAGIGAMAIMPGAPVTYRKMLKGPGDKNLAGSFQATMALLSIVLVPLWVVIIVALFPNLASAPVATVFKQVMLAQVIPLVVGAAISHWLPELTQDYGDSVFRISTAMLIAVLVLVLAIGLPLVLKAGVIQVLAVIIMAAVALLAGHLLAGPNPMTSQTIAVANATRNAGLALVLMTLNFPNVKHEILTTIAAYAVISAIAGAIYTRLNQRNLTRVAEPS